jgi:hypothetical protein
MAIFCLRKVPTILRSRCFRFPVCRRMRFIGNNRSRTWDARRHLHMLRKHVALSVMSAVSFALFLSDSRTWSLGVGGVGGGVGAGLVLLTLARVLCWLYFLSLLARCLRSHPGFWGGVLTAVVGVGAGLLLLTLARVQYKQQQRGTDPDHGPMRPSRTRLPLLCHSDGPQAPNIPLKLQSL